MLLLGLGPTEGGIPPTALHIHATVLVRHARVPSERAIPFRYPYCCRHGLSPPLLYKDSEVSLATSCFLLLLFAAFRLRRSFFLSSGASPEMVCAIVFSRQLSNVSLTFASRPLSWIKWYGLLKAPTGVSHVRSFFCEDIRQHLWPAHPANVPRPCLNVVSQNPQVDSQPFVSWEFPRILGEVIVHTLCIHHQHRRLFLEVLSVPTQRKLWVFDLLEEGPQPVACLHRQGC